MLVQASPKVVDMVSRYDRSAEEVHKARKQFAHISQVLVNLVTVRFRADAPPRVRHHLGHVQDGATGPEEAGGPDP